MQLKQYGKKITRFRARKIALIRIMQVVRANTAPSDVVLRAALQERQLLL
jgi:hypothetical protein